MAITFETRPINQKNDWPLYKDRHPVEEIDRQLVIALSSSSAAAFWRDVVARRWKPLPRFLPATHWSSQPVAYGPNWYTQWNSPVDPDPVEAFLRATLPWANNNVVFIVMDGDTIYNTTWKLFLKYWSAFLFNNEDVIIVSPNCPDFVRFVETGVLFKGQRELTSTLDQEFELVPDR